MLIAQILKLGADICSSKLARFLEMEDNRTSHNSYWEVSGFASGFNSAVAG